MNTHNKQYTTSDFNYVLPEKLIAQFPLKERTASRMLVVDRREKSLSNQAFSDLLQFVKPNDLLVFNDTKVIPARLMGVKETGGKLECLVERVLSEKKILAHIRSSKSPKPGQRIILSCKIRMQMLARQGDLFELESLESEPILDLIERYGAMPLPPYITRKPDDKDLRRYQTVYAQQPGAVAAPTAGLHFDEAILARLTEKGVQRVSVTLHVGAGTFQPVRSEALDEHVMHSEWMSLSQDACDKINACKAKGGRVIAVGTTSVRCLETAAQSGQLKAYEGNTNLFITPGFEFHCVDGLITNFHLPKSTLLMLVSAFAGYDLTLKAYQQAVAEKYRFFSYGDAMLIF